MQTLADRAVVFQGIEAAGTGPGALAEALRTNTERLFPALVAISR